MSQKETKHITARTTLEFKKEIEDFAKQHNCSTSNLIISSLQTCIKTKSNSTTIYENDLLHELALNLVRNKIMNIINLDCNIPDHTKQKIKKELNKID